MKVSDFDFHLPEDRIALRPMAPREAARLLEVADTLNDRHVADLPSLLRAGDLLILNNTKVLPTQLKGTRDRGGQTASFEATLIKSLDGQSWQAFLKPGKRIREGDRVAFGDLTADILSKNEDGVYVLRFTQSPSEVINGLHRLGGMPLPPYIRSKRAEDAQDLTDYQTVFARDEGSVAAPTAGLHFTPELLETIRAKGVLTEEITLHVGAGTFLPVKVEDTDEHKMHAEFGIITADSAARINAVRQAGGRLICVGTTALRLLESACDDQGVIHPFAAETSIFITPGVRVNSADVLLTNFHLPKSTLFMLVCAFAGTERMKSAYDHAIETGYRFFSYGDACLLTNTSR
ncbi:tRNA preQ1(34) S-adenosylmethionine ribosyltransferase-isomerase QueA [Asticcacaulis sp. YBE204]|uniref:tRNA preQ1(34) S-adenosylmethionine ribosyltransferase-isomerase QueA n=1 Tax=Asticcacaulis sp. YBE204 TaxID=1282363 RepID=UPI0003C3ABF4|nr:tRNA preQ1(34) S-adenosylmethionine ribosyltransferase-isomerase QueA [Asticcacaulis sp. YBE204]ESQ78818.1 S-adenosylmethionine tRNA ribosyltransferase [Asticcacaulis sp. YBE204]